MPKKRRLGDLYVVGKALTFDDGKGDPVKVWIQKLNPAETELVLRRADAARASILAIAKQPGTEAHLAIAVEAEDFPDIDSKIEYLIAEETGKIQQLREAELAGEDEWTKDNYLQGLRDAWLGGLNKTYVENNDDPEGKRVYEELVRFNNIVGERSEKEVEDLRKTYKLRTEENIDTNLLERMFKVAGDIAWLNQFRRAEIWRAVRDDEDHREYYFPEVDEVKALPKEIYAQLLDEYLALAVEIDEGKD